MRGSRTGCTRAVGRSVEFRNTLGLVRVLNLLSQVQDQLRGCPFIDAAAEFPDPTAPAHRYAATQKRRMVARLAELLTTLGVTDLSAAKIQWV